LSQKNQEDLSWEKRIKLSIGTLIKRIKLSIGTLVKILLLGFLAILPIFLFVKAASWIYSEVGQLLRSFQIDSLIITLIIFVIILFAGIFVDWAMKKKGQKIISIFEYTVYVPIIPKFGEFPGFGKQLGFVTAPDTPKDKLKDDDILTVYIPNSPNFTAGRVIFIEKKDCFFIDEKESKEILAKNYHLENAFTFIVTMGKGNLSGFFSRLLKLLGLLPIIKNLVGEKSPSNGG